MQANIIREIQSSQEAYNERLERAQLERETKIISDMNERFDRFQDEKAKLDTRAMEQKGELHAKGLKRTKDAAQKAANETAKVKVLMGAFDAFREIMEPLAEKHHLKQDSKRRR